MSNTTLTLPAIELKQNGTRMLITKMRASDLIKFTKIDRYDSTLPYDHPKQGYQRNAETPRVKKFANWLRKENEVGNQLRMPTAILLSARDSDISISGQGTITLKSNTKLSIVDGQHRTKGFEYAIEEKGLTQFGDYDLPVVILQDIDRVGEMQQFRIVNGEQKSVRMDLVNSILTQMVEREGDSAVDDSKSWGVVTSRVVKMLNEDPDGPWADRIVMADQRSYSRVEILEDEELRHRRIIRATSFLTSLKPVEAYLVGQESIKPDTRARTKMLFEVVDGFWRAVREINPVCFENADDYVLLKTPGLFSLHTMLVPVLKDMRRGKRDWTQKEFEVVLADCEELADPRFWAVGNKEERIVPGDASKYGSMKGFKELADLLYGSLHS